MNGVKTIEGLRRGLQVLSALKFSSAASLTELHRETGLPKATLLRILKTLLEEGWVERHEVGNRYVLCSEGRSADPQENWRSRLNTLTAPHRAALQKQVPWPIEVAVRDGTSMLVLDWRRPTNGLAANYRALGVRPHMLISSLGRCYLAFCDAEEREEILSKLARSTQVPNRLASKPETIKRLIADAKQLGYTKRDASEVEGDSPERFEAIAVPIFCNGRLVATMACAWLQTITSEREIVSAYLKRLQNTALAIQNELESVGFAFEAKT